MQTPLLAACEAGAASCVAALIRAKASVSFEAGSKMETFLEHAGGMEGLAKMVALAERKPKAFRKQMEAEAKALGMSTDALQKMFVQGIQELSGGGGQASGGAETSGDKKRRRKKKTKEEL